MTSASTEKKPRKRAAAKKPEVEENAATFLGQYADAVGRRKTAVALVRFFPKGSGRLLINGKDWKKYFPFVAWQQVIEQPLKIVKVANDGDFSIQVSGGGIPAQADAVQLGIARALVTHDAGVKSSLRAGGLLTRDPRAKERKKPGLKRARRGPQFAKR